MLIKRQRIPILQIALVGFLPSPIKKIVYCLKGYKIGRGVSIGLGSVIIGKDVEIKDKAKIGFMTVIRGKRILIERFVQIGSMVFIDCDKVRIGEDSRINEQVIIGGLKTPTSEIDIGERTIIMEYSFINPTLPIKIGDDTGIGGHCLIFTHGSWLNALDGFSYKFAQITIGKNVWLAWRVFILPGVEIGDNVVIGADSLVSKSIPSNSLAAGERAKVIKSNYPKPLNNDERKKLIEMILEEFFEYVRYYKFTVTKDQNETGKTIIISKKGKRHLIFYNNFVLSKQYQGTNNVLLIDRENQIDYDNKFRMILDIPNKTRIGSSEIGEELTKYFSRYGIRFKRLD